jgi:hypothetical protein
MEMNDKLYAAAAVCPGKNNGTSLEGGGVHEGPRAGLDVFREAKKFLPLPGLKPRIAESP